MGEEGTYKGQKPNLMRLESTLLLKMETGYGPMYGTVLSSFKEWSLLLPVTGSLVRTHIRTLISCQSSTLWWVTKCLSWLVTVIGSLWLLHQDNLAVPRFTMLKWRTELCLRLAEATLTGQRVPDSEAESSAGALLEVFLTSSGYLLIGMFKPPYLPWGQARSCQEGPFSS